MRREQGSARKHSYTKAISSKKVLSKIDAILSQILSSCRFLEITRASPIGGAENVQAYRSCPGGDQSGAGRLEQFLVHGRNAGTTLVLGFASALLLVFRRFP
jgi:hypothetical protein